MTTYTKEMISSGHATEVLSRTSARYLDIVIQENLTAKEAVEFMKSGMKLRTFTDNLTAFYKGEDLEQKLLEGLCRYRAMSRQSIRRKVYNWLHNKNLPQDREEMFCICFILELDETASDHLLKRLTGQGIHYRDVRELVYAYCLKRQILYEQAKQMADTLVCPAPVKESGRQPLTDVYKSRFHMLQSQEELLQFLLENKSCFGEYHNTAYSYFMQMLDLLTDAGEAAYSLETVADTYLRMNMPLNKRTSGFGTIQKLVKKHWPGSRSIKAMKNRTQDVSRKALLLLYIVTGGVHADDYEELDEDYVMPDEFLEQHCRSINRMLTESGMARIDPRNAFDFLILYAIRPQEEGLMSEKMAEIVRQLYQDFE